MGWSPNMAETAARTARTRARSPGSTPDAEKRARGAAGTPSDDDFSESGDGLAAAPPLPDVDPDQLWHERKGLPFVAVGELFEMGSLTLERTGAREAKCVQCMPAPSVSYLARARH